MQNTTKEDKLRIQEISEHLEQFKNDPKGFETVLRFYSFLFFGNSHALFIYPGSKEKMKEDLNEIYDFLYEDKVAKTNKGFDTFIDVFGGGFNSTLALMDILQTSGVKNYVFNDIDPVIYTSHKLCKTMLNEMISEFSEIIRTKFIIPYGSFYLDRKLFESIKTEIVEEFHELQKNKDYSYKLAIRFIFLRAMEYSGTIKYNEYGHKISKKVFDMTKATNEIFRVIPKLEKFNEFYNNMDVQFYNMDAFELLKLDEFKNRTDILLNLDPPYIKQEEHIYTEDELEKLTNKDLSDCSIDYDQPNFPHIEIFDLFSKYNIIYNNNYHQIVDFYATKENSNISYFDRKELIGATNDNKANIVREIIVYKNSLS